MEIQKRLIFLFLITLFSANCQAQLLPDEPIRFHKDYTEKGLVFGSITFPNEKMKFDQYIIQVTYLSTDKKLWRRNSGHIKSGPTSFTAKHFGELNGGKTYLFAVEKPPGNYAISLITVREHNLLQANPTDINLTGFNIPFTVNKGEITYIGEININEHNLKSPEVILLNDEFERDRDAMKGLQKFVNWDSASKSKLELSTIIGK